MVFRGGTGEPLVLIHGFSGTLQLWDPILADLERSFDVLGVSLAGHVGGPEFGAAPVGVSSLVDAVERDLDAAGFGTAHLVGNSLGGWIALELATRGRARSRLLPVERYSQRLREMLPAAEWVALPGAGHVPMSDEPELVARTITRFAGRAREPLTAVS